MRRLTAEAIGTFGVMFLGSLAILATGEKLGDAGIAIAFGLALGVMTAAVAPLSGAHLNPAVTLAAVLTRRMTWRTALGYAAAQLGGGTLGAFVALRMASGRPGGAPLAARALATGYDRLSPGFYGLEAALGAEVLLTALFVFALLGAQRSASLPAVAGVGYGLVHFVGRPITGFAGNPARAVGPALFAGPLALEQLWLFVLAPLAGAALAALAYRFVFAPDAAAQYASAGAFASSGKRSASGVTADSPP